MCLGAHVHTHMYTELYGSISLARKCTLELGSDYNRPLRGICSSFTLKMGDR